MPYGLSLSTWGAGAAVQHFRGMPELWEIFLFVAGGMGGYVLATLPVMRELKESGPAAPDARMALTGTLHMVAVGAAIGAAALVGKIHGWIAWPLGGAAAILVYLLVAGAEFQIAPQLPLARRQDTKEP